MNKKAKLGLAVLAGLGVLGAAVTASAAPGGSAPRQRRPIGPALPPEYDQQSPGFVPSDALSSTQANAAGNANAALDNLGAVLQGAAPAMVQAAADALRTGQIPAGLPAPIADAVAQAGQAASTNDAAQAAGPAATPATQAAATLATQIQQAAPAVQQAAAAAAEALATGQSLPPEVVAAASPILEAVASAAQAAGVTAPSPAAVEQPTMLPDDTALLLEIMLGDEAHANWKRKVPELIPWQRDRNLVADGMFGPKSALVLAEETGLIPIVRYWPTGSYREGKWLKDYRASLLAEAATAEEPRASQLRAAANREQGQAFAPVQPITTLIALG